MGNNGLQKLPRSRMENQKILEGKKSSMKDCQFTLSQKRRLKELGADSYVNLTFKNEKERDNAFDNLATILERKHKEALLNLLTLTKRPLIRQLESKLIEALTSAGFVEVNTPFIIPRKFIECMGIRETHKLWKQIHWLRNGRCLRPMLAPNLYHIMRLLRKFTKPVSIFEIGPCFRKESKGREHVEEFTMLNVVELAPNQDPFERLKEIINIVTKTVELPHYRLRNVKSEIYGETMDVIVDEHEIASAVVGPHSLDKNWGIFEAWAGVGFGIERIAMVKKDIKRIRHVARSLTYLDGASLDVQ
ncbi:pyrrolysine--tRNA(Pyl) ligase large subunit [Candidatus Bathyarchaeota archaeon]|nr:MAG: pyrrolysine--tRNA(Pyl) ligase large subunit [Candidatus Bathyarchaeota archaeon]